MCVNCHEICPPEDRQPCLDRGHTFQRGEAVYLPVDDRVWTVVCQKGAMVTLHTHTVSGGAVTTTRHRKQVSYKPWPAAVHGRPTQVGWHLVRWHDGLIVGVGRWDGDHWHTQTSPVKGGTAGARSIRFLGETLE